MLKTRREGYDGKGQYRIKHPDEITTAWEQLHNHPLLLENTIPFTEEVSQIAVRDRQGNCAFYPLSNNHHEQGILRYTLAPYDNESLTQQAQHATQLLLDHLNYVGVIAVEFFVHNHQLIANEFAPRVHNSGHWTLEGAVTSQFENHLRAICGFSLGCTEAIGYSAMINCIGEEPSLTEMLKQPNLHYHHYGKSPRPNRKVAHMTLHCQDPCDIHDFISRKCSGHLI